jgi:hypothetical protein
MSRNIDAGMLAPLLSNYIQPCFLASIAFKSQTIHCWTGAGTLSYDGNNYLGVGDFGKLGQIFEGTDVYAYGTTISLSGIDPNILTECLTDIQLGAPVTIYFALLNTAGEILGVPYPLFVGTVDKPTVTPGVDEIGITLTLENRLADLQRPNLRRYTSADQRRFYPNDTGFNWVEMLNDLALKWNA